MVYGHAERTLATIRLLETETAALLRPLPWLDAEQLAWLHSIDGGGHGTHQPERRPGPRPGPFAAGPEPFTAKDYPPQSNATMIGPGLASGQKHQKQTGQKHQKQKGPSALGAGAEARQRDR